jgi:hypothetical protein
VYPLALVLAVGEDTVTGQGAFFDEFLFGSKRRLLEQLLSDWLDSGIWWIPISLMVIVCGRIFRAKICLYGAITVGLGVIFISFLTPHVPVMFGSILGLSLAVPAVFNIRTSSR